MAEICHLELAKRQLPARRVPVQVEDHVQACLVQAGDISLDRRPVPLAAVAPRSAIDAQPAVLVKRQPHGVDPP
jgi:hypothetical protein